MISWVIAPFDPASFGIGWRANIIVRKVKDIDTGGRPTPIDSPIILRSMTNNVGFEINGQSLIETLKIPF
jgi:hypothetical protein